MVILTITVDITEIIRKLERLKADLPAMLLLGIEDGIPPLKDAIQTNILTKDDPGFAKRTEDYHARKGHPTPHRGLLDQYYSSEKNSMYGSFELGAAGNVFRQEGTTTVAYGTNRESQRPGSSGVYPIVQELGDEPRMPARPFFGPALQDPSVRSEMLRKIADSVRQSLRRI